MRLLIVTAVDQETDALGSVPDAHIVTAGVGRTNAAAATVLAAVAHGPFDAVLSVGVAGALPGADLAPGDLIAADVCVYAEEGIVTPDGFLGMDSLGFPLSEDGGNTVACDAGLVRTIQDMAPILPIATVATCSGTDAAAEEVRRRTGCAAEAMEGAAVVHAASKVDLPAIEVRAISNTTGDRDRQQWNLPAALATLSAAMPAIRDSLR